MFETPITVTGRVVTDVTTRTTATGTKMATFRIACQERRYDRERDEWVDGDRMYVGVVGWGRLVDGVTALEKGDHVVVSGRLKVREYTTEDGATRAGPEISATSVGPDLAWHNVIINRHTWGAAEQLSLVPAESQPDAPGGEVAAVA